MARNKTKGRLVLKPLPPVLHVAIDYCGWCGASVRGNMTSTKDGKVYHDNLVDDCFAAMKRLDPKGVNH